MDLFPVLNVNLLSLSALSYASASFVKMTAANTFSLDTNSYSLATHDHGGVYEPVLTKYNLSGTTNQITLSGSGTGVLLARDLTLSLPQDIAKTSHPEFAYLGIGTAPNAENAIRCVKSYTGSSGTSEGIYFNPAALPSSSGTLSVNAFSAYPAHWTGKTISGLTSFFSQPQKVQNGNCKVINSFSSQPIFLSGAAGTVDNLYHFRALDLSWTGSATLTTCYAFYDAGQTRGGTNWGLAINTQSYINANLSVGKNTAPAYALDVAGEINATTGYRINGAAGVSGTFTTADSKTVTVTNGIITGIA